MPPVIKNGQGAKTANAVSLVGGVVVAIGVFVIALLIAGEITPASLGIAGAIALAVGIYVRVADM
jgi:hypothetical protein